MKIVVGSKNQRKIYTVKKVFSEILKTRKFEVAGCDVSSGVPETPYGKEIFDGARNRARGCLESEKGADYYIGLESGLVERYGDIYEEAWSCVIANEGKEFAGYSSGLKLPDYVKARMKETDLEHCDVMTVIEKERGLENDTWATYSGGSIQRAVSLEEALRNALLQAGINGRGLYDK